MRTLAIVFVTLGMALAGCTEGSQNPNHLSLDSIPQETADNSTTEAPAESSSTTTTSEAPQESAPAENETGEEPAANETEEEPAANETEEEEIEIDPMDALCPTDDTAVGAGGYYVTVMDAAGGSLWVYQESNDRPGLQRNDETVPTECPIADTIIF